MIERKRAQTRNEWLHLRLRACTTRLR
jgi:hypothetical protein